MGPIVSGAVGDTLGKSAASILGLRGARRPKWPRLPVSKERAFIGRFHHAAIHGFPRLSPSPKQ